MAKIDISCQPRLLSAPEAAKYIGVSETTLRGLPIPRKVLGKRRLFDRYSLDAWVNELPDDGQDHDSGDRDECDRLFGAGC